MISDNNVQLRPKLPFYFTKNPSTKSIYLSNSVFFFFIIGLLVRLEEERAKYLVCELVPQLPSALHQLAAFVR